MNLQEYLKDGEEVPWPEGISYQQAVKNHLNKQPADRGSLKYYLKFPESNESYEIDRPNGFYSVNIGLEQKEGEYARHFTFGESANFEFSPKELFIGHQFERLVEEFKKRNQEARIEVWVYDDTTFLFSAEFRSEAIETNYTSYFRVPVDIKSYKKIIEARADVEVNVLSNKDVDNKAINPISLNNITLQPKEILTISKYSTGEEVKQLPITYGDRPHAYIFQNKMIGEIKNSLEYEAENNSSVLSVQPHALIQTDVPFKLRVVVKNIKGDILSMPENPSANFPLTLIIYFYKFNDNGEPINPPVLPNIVVQSDDSNPKIFERGIFEIDVNVPEACYIIPVLTAGAETFSFNSEVVVQPGGTITFEAVDIYPQLNTKSTPLIEVGKQVMKSITNSAVTIDAPLFDTGGRYNNIHALSGFLVRGFPAYNASDPENPDNKPFIATWNEFESVIRSAFNCDWQLVENKIQILQHHEFYKDVEAHRFDFTLNRRSFKTTPNDRYQFNKLEFNYKTFEDNKDSTIDSIHTESSWVQPNSRLSESEDIEIPYIADGYKIEYARREGLETEGSRAKSEDDSIYMIDTVNRGNLLYNATDEYVTAGNVFSPETMYNLRLSPKRLLIDNYPYYLANMTQLVQGNIRLKNTYFKNNGFANTTGKDPSKTTTLYLVENEDLTTNMVNYIATPLISNMILKVSLNKRIKFDEIFEIINSVQTTNGYLTFPLDDGTEIKLYVVKFDYNKQSETLEIIGEEKYIQNDKFNTLLLQ